MPGFAGTSGASADLLQELGGVGNAFGAVGLRKEHDLPLGIEGIISSLSLIVQPSASSIFAALSMSMSRISAEIAMSALPPQSLAVVNLIAGTPAAARTWSGNPRGRTCSRW